MESVDTFEGGTMLSRRRHSDAAVATVLDTLASEGYVHLDGWLWQESRAPGAEHLLVGPAGAFVVATVAWASPAMLPNVMPAHGDRRRVRGTADVAAARDGVCAAAGLPTSDVAPVLCLVGAEHVPPFRVEDTVVTSLTTLARWLRSRPARLDTAAVNRVVRALGETLRHPEETPARTVWTCGLIPAQRDPSTTAEPLRA